MSEPGRPAGSGTGRAPAGGTDLLARVVVPSRLALIVRGEYTAGYNPRFNVWHLVDPPTAETLRWLRAGRDRAGLAGHLHRRFATPPQEAHEQLLGILRWCLLRRLLHLDREPVLLLDSSATRLSTVYWICTQACNLRCTYCYQEATVARPRELTTAEALDLVDQVHEAGADTMVFTGGEPFSRRDLLTVAAHSKELGLRTHVITNGHYVTPRTVARIASIFDLVTVSLDHLRPEHHDRHRGQGSWQRAHDAVRLLLDRGVPVDLNSTLDRHGLRDLDDLLRLRELPIGQHKVVPSFPMGRGAVEETEALTPEQLLSLGDTIGARERARTEPLAGGRLRPEGGDHRKGQLRNHCGAGLSEVSVDPEGWVYTCKLLQYAPFRGDNVRDARLREIYDSSPAMLASRARTTDRLPTCRTCVIRDHCGGGCRGIQYSYTGDPTASHPLFCGFLRRGFETALWQDLGVTPPPRRSDYRQGPRRSLPLVDVRVGQR